jgi:acyl CoA:acetate/3-ketoacid CoA transferase beta subunit
LVLLEKHPDYTVDQIRVVTEAPMEAAPELKDMVLPV